MIEYRPKMESWAIVSFWFDITKSSLRRNDKFENSVDQFFIRCVTFDRSWNSVFIDDQESKTLEHKNLFVCRNLITSGYNRKHRFIRSFLPVCMYVCSIDVFLVFVHMLRLMKKTREEKSRHTASKNRDQQGKIQVAKKKTREREKR